MAEILKKIGKDDEKVAKWIASDFKFANDLKKVLENLKNEINKGNKGGIKKLVRQAKGDITQVGRSERRVYRFTQKLEKHIEELMNMLPEALKKEEAEIEEQIKIADRTVLKQGSRYIGSLRLKLDLLSKLLEKNEIKKAIYRIDDLIASIDKLVNWIGGLSALIKKQEEKRGRLAA